MSMICERLLKKGKTFISRAALILIKIIPMTMVCSDHPISIMWMSEEYCWKGLVWNWAIYCSSSSGSEHIFSISQLFFWSLLELSLFCSKLSPSSYNNFLFLFFCRFWQKFILLSCLRLMKNLLPSTFTFPHTQLFFFLW